MTNDASLTGSTLAAISTISTRWRKEASMPVRPCTTSG